MQSVDDVRFSQSCIFFALSGVRRWILLWTFLCLILAKVERRGRRGGHICNMGSGLSLLLHPTGDKCKVYLRYKTPIHIIPASWHVFSRVPIRGPASVPRTLDSYVHAYVDHRKSFIRLLAKCVRPFSE